MDKRQRLLPATLDVSDAEVDQRPVEMLDELPRKRARRSGNHRTACEACRARKAAVSCPLSIPGSLTYVVRLQEGPRHYRCDGFTYWFGPRLTSEPQCDGATPNCGYCTTKNLECRYVKPLKQQIVDLSEKHHQDANFTARLMSLPEVDAIALLRHARASLRRESARVALQGSMHYRQRPSDLRATRGLFPRTSTDLEFELSARHQTMYPVLAHIDVTSPGLFPIDSPRPSLTDPESGPLADSLARDTRTFPSRLDASGRPLVPPLVQRWPW